MVSVIPWEKQIVYKKSLLLKVVCIQSKVLSVSLWEFLQVIYVPSITLQSLLPDAHIHSQGNQKALHPTAPVSLPWNRVLLGCQSITPLYVSHLLQNPPYMPSYCSKPPNSPQSPIPTLHTLQKPAYTKLKCPQTKSTKHKGDVVTDAPVTYLTYLHLQNS